MWEIDGWLGGSGMNQSEELVEGARDPPSCESKRVEGGGNNTWENRVGEPGVEGWVQMGG